jgi:hypothetical protein
MFKLCQVLYRVAQSKPALPHYTSHSKARGRRGSLIKFLFYKYNLKCIFLSRFWITL